MNDAATITDAGAIIDDAGASLKGNFAWALAGNLCYGLCQWGMLMLLAKLGTATMLGQFALGLAVTAPIIIFTNLKLRQVQATDARREYSFGDYLALRLIATLLALGVIACVALMGRYQEPAVWVILAVAVAKSFESLSDIYHGLLQRHERMDLIARSMMIKGPASLIALGAALYLTGSIVWATVALAVVWALMVGYDARNGARMLESDSVESADGRSGIVVALRPRWSPATSGRLAKLALPLGFVTMLGALSTSVPRFFVEGMLGPSELGYFAAMGYFLVAGHNVAAALAQAATPRLARHHASGNRPAFVRILLRLIGAGVVIGIAGVVFSLVAGRQVLSLAYGPEYGDRVVVLVYLMIAAAVTYAYTFLGTAINAMRVFHLQPYIHLVAVIVIMFTSWIWVRDHGLVGAAWSVCAGAAVEAAAYGTLAVVWLRREIVRQS